MVVCDDHLMSLSCTSDNGRSIIRLDEEDRSSQLTDASFRVDCFLVGKRGGSIVYLRRPPNELVLSLADLGISKQESSEARERKKAGRK